MKPSVYDLSLQRRPLAKCAGNIAICMLPLLLLCAPSSLAQIPFTYTNDNGAITITKYTGDGGALTIPDTIDGLPVTRIGDSAFYEATWRLGSVVIPNTVTSIGVSAFESCSGLTNIVIGNSVTNIGYRAFSGSMLSNVVVPDSVITISDLAFFSSGVASASIGDGVTRIGDAAFGFCSNLKNITIGRSVTDIGSMAFGYCISLRGVYFKGNAPDLRNRVFEMLDATIIYYLPGTSGWTSKLDGRTTVSWNPTILINDPKFGVTADQFTFTITGNTNLTIVIETSPDLSNPVWTPVKTNVLTTGASSFTDSHDTSANRVYRLRAP